MTESLDPMSHISATSGSRPRFQYSTQALLFGVSLGCVLLAAARMHGCAATWAVLCTLVSLGGYPREPSQRVQFGICLGFAAVVPTAVISCFDSLRATDGPYRAIFFTFLFFICSIAGIALCTGRDYRKCLITWALAATVLCLIVIPRQVMLETRLDHLRAEVERIGRYLDAYRARELVLPGDLSEYMFQQPHLSKHVRYLRESDKHYQIGVCVGNEFVTCWYDERGDWSEWPRPPTPIPTPVK